MIRKINILLIILVVGLYSCKRSEREQSRLIEYTLPENLRIELIDEIDRMAELDSKYRSALQLGTLDSAILKRVEELGKKGDMSNYIAFTKTITRTITKSQEDSIKLLQDKLDYQNYLKVKSIINQYGYPSEDRLKVKADNFAPILLHFPMSLAPSQYLDEMAGILIIEVKENRMEAITYARFYDNLMTRFLNYPQKYGTIKKFNSKTMTPGLPEIEDIDETNKLRREIGLGELKIGDYEIKTTETIRKN